MPKHQNSAYNFSQTLADPHQKVKTPKSNRTKFIRDLNHKISTLYERSNKSGKHYTNSKEKDNVIGKQRQRKESSYFMSSLLQKALPGARITKGEWKDNKLNGDVFIEYNNGNKFEGRYMNGLRVEGKMIYAQAKCQYQGSFFGEKFSGYGKLAYYEGRSIEGEWDSMELLGNATITYPNGDVYYGPVDEKLHKHGQGYIFLKNGQKYVGSFKNGSITGQGCYYKDQKLVIRGFWKKGNLVKKLKTEEDTELDSLQNELDVHFHTVTNEQSSTNKTKKLRNSLNNNQSHSELVLESSVAILNLKQKSKHNSEYLYDKDHSKAVHFRKVKFNS